MGKNSKLKRRFDVILERIRIGHRCFADLNPGIIDNDVVNSFKIKVLFKKAFLRYEGRSV